MTYGIAMHEPPVFVFRVRPRRGAYLQRNAEETWRDIAIAGDQTMEDLASYILQAYDFDNDHLSSFYMSGKRWDRSSEVKVASGDEFMSVDFMFHPSFRQEDDWPTEALPHARDLLVRDAPLPGKSGKKEFLYLFDFGDNWEFGIRLREKLDVVDPHAIYPRVIASMGEGPDQYPAWDDGWDDDLEGDSEETIDNVVLPFPTPPSQPCRVERAARTNQCRGDASYPPHWSATVVLALSTPLACPMMLHTALSALVRLNIPRRPGPAPPT